MKTEPNNSFASRIVNLSCAAFRISPRRRASGESQSSDNIQQASGKKPVGATVRCVACLRRCCGVCAAGSETCFRAGTGSAGSAKDSERSIGLAGGADRSVSGSTLEPDAGGFHLSARNHSASAMAGLRTRILKPRR